MPKKQGCNLPLAGSGATGVVGSAEEHGAQRPHPLLSRALLSREPEPAASPQLRPSLPRADSDFFFARARRRAPTVDGLREEADEDAMVDTRLLLMLKYPDDKAPLRERVALRYSALRYHVRRLLRDATRVSGAARDALIIFSAWVAVAAAEGYRPGAAKQATIDATASGGDDDGHQQTTSAALFFALFEITSAFGNVGLSLGSLRHQDRAADFSQDLNAISLICVAIVCLFGRTRDLPATLDSSLALPKMDDATRSTMFSVPRLSASEDYGGYAPPATPSAATRRAANASIVASSWCSARAAAPRARGRAAARAASPARTCSRRAGSAHNATSPRPSAAPGPS